MTGKGGGFLSAEDADSVPPERAGDPHAQKTEGAFYLWRADEVDGLLGDGAPIAKARFGIEAGGNAPADPQQEFTGKNLLYVAQSVDDLARQYGKAVSEVEELLAERGIDASYETVRRWFLKFGPSIAANIRRSRPRPSDHWHLDKMVISIRGGKYWLWRAVDNEGEVLDFLVQRRRDAQAAKKLMVKLLKKHGFAPSRVVTDRLRSYPAAFRAIGLMAEHDAACEQTTGRRTRISRYDAEPALA